MERAGAAAADVARRLAGDRAGPIVVLAGPGNNGGDALVVARVLRGRIPRRDRRAAGRSGAPAAPMRRPRSAPSSRPAARRWRRPAPRGRRSSSTVSSASGSRGRSRRRTPRWSTGPTRPARRCSRSTCPAASTPRPDVAHSPCVRAAATATFIALKPGLLTGRRPRLLRRRRPSHALGLDAAPVARGHRLDWPALAPTLPPVLARRMRNVNKGTFGTLGILGGTEGMGGALILAGRAALRVGAGKVWLGFLMADPPKLDTGMPELMLRHAGAVLDAQPDAFVVGPGLGTSDAARSLLARTLATQVPVALDADALNLVARDAALLAAVVARTAPDARDAASRRGRARARRGRRRACRATASRAARDLVRRLQRQRRAEGRGQRARPSGRHVGHQRERRTRARDGRQRRRAVRHRSARCSRRASTRARRCAWPSACTAPPPTRSSRRAAARSASPRRNSPTPRARCSTPRRARG